jgi:hypothetical protein
VLCAAAILLAAAAPARALPPGSGGVVVDGAVLPAARIWQEYRYQNALRSMVHARDVNQVDEKLFSGVVEECINAEILVREAARRGITASDEDRARAREAEVARWRGEDKLKTTLAMLQVDEAFLVARALDNLVVRRMTESFAGTGSSATEAELQSYYRENPGRYQAPHEIRYIFRARKARSRQELDNAFNLIIKEAEEARGSGRSYAEIARKWSEHESGRSGGAVAERLREGAPGLSFQPVREGLKDCRLTRLMTDDAGTHLYLRDCSNTIPYPEVRDRVSADQLAGQRKLWLDDLRHALREKAVLEYRVSEELPAPPAAAPPAAAPPAPTEKSAPSRKAEPI